MLKLDLNNEEVLFLEDLLISCEDSIENSLNNNPEPEDGAYMSQEIIVIKKVLEMIKQQR
ncbi:MAG: hypothetical protein ACRCW1_00515 [Anaerotignaceae bacterium]